MSSKVNMKNNKRITIGLILDDISDDYEIDIWLGIMDKAEELDINLLCFSSGEVHLDSNELRQANVLYNMINANTVDGLIFLTAALVNDITQEEMEEFVGRYSDIPMVSVAQTLKGTTTILVDNKKGMYDAVAHLINEHGKKNIAFVKGPDSNPEAIERLEAYKEALEDNGLKFNPNLVCPGDFETSSGEIAVKTLLNKRKVEFDAIVGADDYTAFGAVKELQRQGKNIPGDIAVVGFDDIEESRFLTPPVTTVRQPLFDQGRKSVEIIVDLIHEKQVDKEIFLATEVVFRHSCGCIDPTVVHAGLVHEKLKKAQFDTGSFNKEHFITHMTNVLMSSPIKLSKKYIHDILSCFWREISGGPAGCFLNTLDEILATVVQAGGDLLAWQEVFSSMRLHFMSMTDNRQMILIAEDLWQQARVMVGENAERAQAYRRFIAKQQAVLLRAIGQALITTFELDDLLNVIHQEIPRAEIPSCYVAAFDGKEHPPEKAKVILAYDRNGRIELDNDDVMFECCRELIPSKIFKNNNRYSMMVLPLFFSYNDIGYTLVEIGPKSGEIYDAIRVQMSTSLQGSLLLEELKEKQREEVRRLKKEMEIAQKIQTALLPGTPKIRDYDLAAVMHPADDVGGDYYDFFIGEDGRHWYIIGDVSGHGLTAGLIMLMAQSSISTVVKSNPTVDIKKLYSDVNALLFDNIRHRLLTDHFMTLSIIAMDMNNNFTIIGSHIEQLVYRAKEGTCSYVESKGVWAGLMPNVEQTVVKRDFTLDHGDILLLFTDGLIEAMDEAGDQYDNERVEAIIKENHDKSADEIKTLLLQNVFDFMDHQADDITIVVIKRK